MAYSPVSRKIPIVTVPAGSAAVGDNNTYSSFTPASATVKAALTAIDTVLSGGGGLANVHLSNLLSPTSINQSLAFSADGTLNIGSPDGGTTLLRPNKVYVASSVLIGLGAPIQTPDVATFLSTSTTSSSNLVLPYISNLAGAGAQIRLLKSLGAVGALVAVQSGNALATISLGGYDSNSGAAGWKNSSNIIASATENWDTTHHGTQVIMNAVPTGSNNATARLTLSGDGNVTVTPSLLWAADGGGSIGLTGAQRPLDLFLKRNLVIGGATSGAITIAANATTTPYAILFPAAQGAASTVLTNDGSGNLSWTPSVSALTGTVSTTDATPTTVQTLSTVTDNCDQLSVSVVGRRTGGSAGAVDDSAAYVLLARIKNVAGTVTIVDLQTDYASEDQPAWDATLSVSGTNVLVTVTGAALNNINWSSTTTRQRI